MFAQSARGIVHDSNHHTRLADCSGCEAMAEVLEWNCRPLIVRAAITGRWAAARRFRDYRRARQWRREHGNPPF